MNNLTIVVIGLAVAVLFLGGTYLAISHSGDRAPFNTYSSSEDHMMSGDRWGMPMMSYREYSRDRSDDRGSSYGANSEYGEWPMYGMMGMYGMEECEEHMREYEEKYSTMRELVEVTGTIVGVDRDRDIVEVLIGNNTIVSFKLAGMYVDKSNGYLVFGEWLVDNLREGQEVVVTSLREAGMMELLPVVAIEVDSSIYVIPHYYETVETS